MAKNDYYDTLGVSKGTDTSDIKKAYRKMAMKFHPDQNQDNPQAEEKFKEINEAWEVLQDDQKRSAYDQYGHAAFENGGGGAGRGNPFGQGFGGADFSDVFGDMFGGGRGGRRRGPEPGNDLRYGIDITLEEAFSGTETDISISTAINCKPGSGSGATGNSKKSSCSTCGGHCVVRMKQGFFVTEQECPECSGQGEKIENPCSSCRGSGRSNGSKSLSANIPAVVDEGTRIRLSGEGEAGMCGAPNGDLYLFVSVKAHDLFEREGDNILLDMPVSMTKAALGSTVEVPTIDGGRVEIKIPVGTQSGMRFRIRGRGMSILRSGSRGDMFVKVKVETPTNLNKAQKELLQQLDADLGEDNSPNAEGLLSKIKSFWNN